MKEVLSMLVVEDNDLQRESVCMLAKDRFPDLNIAEAPNGRDALILLIEHPFDILFTDIRMPFMDGLQLAEKARQLYKDIQIVIFSAYDDFMYAKQAISIGVSQYILKPLVLDDFSTIMEEVMKNCLKTNLMHSYVDTLERRDAQSQDDRREKILLDYVYGYAIAPDEHKILMQYPFIPGNRQKILILADYPEDFLIEYEAVVQDYTEKSGVFHIGLNPSQGLMILEQDSVITSGSTWMEMFIDFIGALSPMNVYLAISMPFQDIAQLPVIYSSLERTMEKRFFYNSSAIIQDALPNSALETSDTEEQRVMDLLSTVKELLLEKLYDQVGLCISHFLSTALSTGFTRFHIQYIGCRLMEMFMGNPYREMRKDFIMQVFEMESVAEIQEYLLGCLLDIKESALASVNDQLMHQIVRLIKAHYPEGIGLEWLAEKVGISPGYLSAYFKHKMGVTLLNFLTQHRVQCAINLLRNSDMKIRDIAVRTGYPNHTYFCALFKKTTGMTPAQCRLGEDGGTPCIT